MQLDNTTALRKSATKEQRQQGTKFVHAALTRQSFKSKLEKLVAAAARYDVKDANNKESTIGIYIYIYP
eukprot:11211171-Lingulodinium_polyedra.AAC.1